MDAEFLFLEAGSDREGSPGDRRGERCTTRPLARQRRSALARNERGSAVRCEPNVEAQCPTVQSPLADYALIASRTLARFGRVPRRLGSCLHRSRAVAAHTQGAARYERSPVAVMARAQGNGSGAFTGEGQSYAGAAYHEPPKSRQESPKNHAEGIDEQGSLAA